MRGHAHAPFRSPWCARATFFYMGEYATAWMHLEQGIAHSDPAAADPSVPLWRGTWSGCLADATLTLWCLGYPAQAMRRCQEALAQALAHPYHLGKAQHWAAYLHYYRREVQAVQAQANTLLTLATVRRGFRPG